MDDRDREALETGYKGPDDVDLIALGELKEIETVPDSAIEMLPDNFSPFKDAIDQRLEDEGLRRKTYRLLDIAETKAVLDRIPNPPTWKKKKKKKKIWILSSPNNELYEVRNLSEFCRDNNLNYQGLMASFRYCYGKRNGNWKILEKKIGNKVLHAGYKYSTVKKYQEKRK